MPLVLTALTEAAKKCGSPGPRRADPKYHGRRFDETVVRRGEAKGPRETVRRRARTPSPVRLREYLNRTTSTAYRFQDAIKTARQREAENPARDILPLACLSTLLSPRIPAPATPIYLNFLDPRPRSIDDPPYNVSTPAPAREYVPEIVSTPSPSEEHVPHIIEIPRSLSICEPMIRPLDTCQELVDPDCSMNDVRKCHDQHPFDLHLTLLYVGAPLGRSCRRRRNGHEHGRSRRRFHGCRVRDHLEGDPRRSGNG